MNLEEKLKKEALDAMAYSYAPYSNINVGAAILSDDGSISKGANIENASYGITVCAERVALFKAVSEGRRKFKAIVIVSNVGPLTPCGACRQALFEFSPEMDVIVAHDTQSKKWRLEELLPAGFSLVAEEEPVER
ncbi:MAG: cytidine deaminase [Nitrososphaerales archaeon]